MPIQRQIGQHESDSKRAASRRGPVFPYLPGTLEVGLQPRSRIILRPGLNHRRWRQPVKWSASRSRPETKSRLRTKLHLRPKPLSRMNLRLRAIPPCCLRRIGEPALALGGNPTVLYALLSEPKLELALRYVDGVRRCELFCYKVRTAERTTSALCT